MKVFDKFSKLINFLTVEASLIKWLIISFGVISFWILSRFTVDDAFITWRYGLNLVEFGIWNYNPINFDLTQSYTNPLLALLSIIPAYFDLNVVLFFKLISLFFTLLAIYFFTKQLNTVGVITALFIILMPVSIVHAFSGLETFFFVAFLAATYIFAYENNKKAAYSLSIILFFIRPESWLLAILLPIYFAFAESKIPIVKFKLIINATLVSEVAILSLLIFIFLLLNYFYFDVPLPNAFYIKSGKEFSILRFLTYAVYFIPIVFISKDKYFSLLILLFFGAMALNNSKSDLLMDYVSRFTYHIVAPLCLTLNYIANNNKALTIHPAQRNYFVNQNVKRGISCLLPLIVCIIFSILNFKSSFGTSAYYPRLINSHGELGLALKQDVHPLEEVISIADAGITPYNSGLANLDYIGLGSKLVAQKGLIEETLNSYKPSIIVLYGDKTNNPVPEYNQAAMLNYIEKNKINYLCSVQFDPNYFLMIYSNKYLPSVEQVCENSKTTNSKIQFSDYLRSLLIPPWHYWKSH